jgi:hypothetical protein
MYLEVACWQPGLERKQRILQCTGEEQRPIHMLVYLCLCRPAAFSRTWKQPAGSLAFSASSASSSAPVNSSVSRLQDSPGGACGALLLPRCRLPAVLASAAASCAPVSGASAAAAVVPSAVRSTDGFQVRRARSHHTRNTAANA